MSFIRDNVCDIRKYLPAFIQSDKEIVGLLQTESAEHNTQRLQLKDILDQFFVKTATWSLPHYEQIYDVTPNPGDTYEQRRNRILLKIQSNQTSTIEYLVSLAKRYMSADSEVSLVEDNEHYKFRIVNKSGSILYSDDLLNALDTYKPAHLQYGITLERDIELTDDEKIRVGLVNANAGIKHIDIPNVPEIESRVTAGVVLMRAGAEHIAISSPDSWHNTTYVGVYRHRTGRITIGGIK